MASTTSRDDRCPLASTGEFLSDVDTPALILDMETFEGNLAAMKEWLISHNIGRKERGDRPLHLRPHAKTHKTAEVALKQISHGGAVGVCVQKLDEASAILDGGVDDILVTNQIVGKKKIARLVSLLRHASKPKIDVIVDSALNVHNIASHLERESESNDLALGVLIEINGGQNRCGVESRNEESIVEIYRSIESYAGLTFRGLHCYGGNLQHVRSPAERQSLVMAGPIAAAERARNSLAKIGVSCDIITGGGTGTFQFEADGGVHNEIQPGSYAFMDVDYSLNDDGKDRFENALFVHTSVVSTASSPGERTVVDAGSKAVSLDCGPPCVTRLDINQGLSGSIDEGFTYECGGDEHGILIHSSDMCGKVLNEGDTLRMIPGHIDPTVNMHDW
eukprot:CAMPEP_0113530784 /NCGR_PEP_ID=MMETSP0015_2-20120614/3137_1 /TAXON_ID=2838 /ORGANISM="Odontella" /LENGTH=391 /DNA_ID=CAMNT_0000429555 /DNA_START=177 /DNA_END=1349 /DNA_ORIENTATION=- /assembly_acc=CAM_ASM_000160